MFFKDFYKITSNYGNRIINGEKSFHKGVDVVGLDSKTILSPVDGIVKTSTIITDKTNLTWQWGHYVRVDTDGNMKLFFCHLSKRLVKAGDTVKKGDPIGIEGNTGYSFGSHLHFEVRNINNVSIDPVAYMLIDNKIQGYENDINGYKKYVQDKIGIDNNTIRYLEFYRYGEELITKLAEGLKNK